MAVISTKYGGTDPVDGDILTAANFSDTIDETSGHHRKTSTGGPVSNTSGSFGIMGSIVFGESGGLWTYFQDTANITSAGDNTTQIRYRISGANFGVQYFGIPNTTHNDGHILPKSGLVISGGNNGIFNPPAGNVAIDFNVKIPLSRPIVDDNMVIYLELDDNTAATGTANSWDMRVHWIKGWISDD